MKLGLHVEANVRGRRVGEEGGVAHHPGGEGWLGESLYLLLADSPAPTEGAQADESIPVSLAYAGSTVQAGVGVAHRPLAQRTREPRGTVAEPGGATGVLPTEGEKAA